MRRTPLSVLLAALAAGLLGPAAAPRGAFANEIKVGSVQTASNREGAWLREDPKPLGKKITRAPFETKVKVLALREMWARVSTETETPQTGWVRVTDLVEPSSLAGGAASSVALGSSEVSAAGRQFRAAQAAARQASDPSAGKQFDRKSELTSRQGDAKLEAAYAAVDQIEESTPTDAEIEEFIREGRLGGVGVGATPNADEGFATLKLLGATGNTEGVTTFEDAFTPLPTPTSDSEFVQRLGVGLKVDQEYWLGRAVAASAIAEYGLDPDEKLQAYVRKIAASITTLSDRLRGTHGGYHIAILASPVPNGISGPGGFVFLTRGAIDMARNEDEIAGVVGHEMAHVMYRHGEQMLRKTREFQAELVRLEDKVRQGPTAGLDCNLCGEMARALSTAANAMANTLKRQGYGKDYELSADWAGSLFLCEVGYRASAIAEYLELLPERHATRWTDLPSSEERIEALRPLVFKHGCPFESDEGAQARLPRFKAYTGRTATGVTSGAAGKGACEVPGRAIAPKAPEPASPAPVAPTAPAPAAPAPVGPPPPQPAAPAGPTPGK